MKRSSNENMIKALSQRSYQLGSAVSVQRKMQVTDGMVSRLGLETELKGHNGCVNCLEWSANGDLLASGSDDLNVILWDVSRHRKLTEYVSGHTGNIFSVKFLPDTGNKLIATCAGDGRVLVQDIERSEVTHLFTCHAARVKRLAVAPGVPNLFWSAAEDGTVMQFDVRDPDSCSPAHPKNVLINLNAFCGDAIECKCVAINNCRVEQLAVGASDQFVRLYDRRMLPLRAIRFPNASHSRGDVGQRAEYERLHLQMTDEQAFAIELSATRYFVPAHLSLADAATNGGTRRSRNSNISCTYVTFSASGDELLANLGGEHVYLYDLDQRTSQCWTLPQSQAEPEVNGSSGADGETETNEAAMESSVASRKAEANAAFGKGHFALAVELYELAITEARRRGYRYAVLHSNLAAALLRRQWAGDVYAALRQCAYAIALDGQYLKAICRFASCLAKLGCYEESLHVTAFLRRTIPSSQLRRNQTMLERIEEEARSGLDARKVPAEQHSSASASASTSDIEAGGTRRLLDFLEAAVRRRVETSNASSAATSESERAFRRAAADYSTRFCGHCNTTTDIKEANFFGDHHIVAGSDDGTLYFWRRDVPNGGSTLVRALRADEAIVNCAQPHPVTCTLASSGIENVVRIWSPQHAEADAKQSRTVAKPLAAAARNQRRMRVDPFEAMLVNMGLGYRLGLSADGGADGEENEDNEEGDRESPATDGDAEGEPAPAPASAPAGRDESQRQTDRRGASHRRDRCSPN